MREITWWQKAVFYQIYPRSFADGNGDGIGDIPGIVEHLDYLQDLGIDAIWLSPHYPSPLFDCGYDISDYTAVAPEYGTLDDFKRFLSEAHQRGILFLYNGKEIGMTDLMATTVVRPTTGSPALVARPGSTIQSPTSTITTISSSSSLT